MVVLTQQADSDESQAAMHGYEEYVLVMMKKFHFYIDRSVSDQGLFQIDFDHYFFDVMSRIFSEDDKKAIVQSFRDYFVTDSVTGEWFIVSCENQYTLRFENKAVMRSWRIEQCRKDSQALQQRR